MFCALFLKIALQKIPILIKKIIFSDEGHFDLVGIWGNKKLTHPKRVTVWCEFLSRGIIGPFFFENKPGEAIIVNRDRYRAISNELKRRILVTFGFSRTALRATQPKLCQSQS